MPDLSELAQLCLHQRPAFAAELLLPGGIDGGKTRAERPLVDLVEVKTAGGKVLGEPMEIPGIGQYVSFIDTEGNRVSVLQRAPREQAKDIKR